jgi:ABC-2 type transport system ATP-binding protein
MDKLSIRNVSKFYRSHIALDDVSFSVQPGRIFGLLGPNGAGKTSLIRIINQITQPDSGSIHIDGVLLKQEHIEKIGYLPEERGLYKKMKVGEQAIYLAQLKGMQKAEAIKSLKFWFEKFEIASWWDKRIEELSKGMAQKIQFITTVVHNPEILILDEPFSGFDPINTNLIKQEILRLKKEGTTILLSTHNMGSVEEICDDIVLINQSKLVLEGEVNALRKAYNPHEYELSFKGDLIGFTHGLWIDFELLDKKIKGDLVTVRVKLLNNKTLNELLTLALKHVELMEVKEVVPSMNDIFIQVVEPKKDLKNSKES